MNLEQLSYLLETVKSGSFAQASKSLYVTPEAISKAISELEKELDVKLFARSGRGIQATASGLLLADEASAILGAVSDFKLLAKTVSPREHSYPSVSLAITTLFNRGSSISAEAVRKLQGQHPGIFLNTHFNTSEACIFALQKRIVDAAIILGPVQDEDFVVREITSVQPYLLFYVNESDTKAIREKIAEGFDLAAPYDFRLNHRIRSQQPSPEGLKCRIVSLSASWEDQVSFLEKGGAILVLDNAELVHNSDKALLVSPSVHTDCSVPICFVRRKDEENPLIAQVYKTLRACIR